MIFDLDGTLIDSRRDICTAVNLTRAHYGLSPLSLDVVSEYIGDGTKKLMARSLLESGIDIDEALRINADFYMQHMTDTTLPYPGVREGLAALHDAGFTLALLSNKSSRACAELLRHFGISGLFEAVLGSDDCVQLKPDPEPVLKIMSMASARPENTWMIGDSYNDIEAGARAGVRSAFVSYGIGQKDGASPDKSFDTFHELTDFLLTERPVNRNDNSTSRQHTQ